MSLFEQQVAEFPPAFTGLGEDPRSRRPASTATSYSTASRARSACGPPSPRSTPATPSHGQQGIADHRRTARAQRAKPGQIVPVDSEHSALAQCLRGGRGGGTPPGPDREWRTVPRLVRERLRDVTPEQALAHPTWAMGPVITVNSATLVNKGLEVIEAHLLFGSPSTGSRSSSTPRAWSTRWSSSSTARPSRRPAPPTMRSRSRGPRPGPTGSTDPRRRSTGPAAQTWEFFPLDDEASRGRAGPEPVRPAAPPGGLQRRQRGLRRRVPGRPAQLRRHRRHVVGRPAHDVPEGAGTLERASTTCSPPTAGPGAAAR